MADKARTKVYCGFPSTGNTHTAQNYAMRHMAEKYKESIEIVYPKDCSFRIFHDFARNEIVREFLETDCDILFMLDSDVVPSTRLFDLIIEHGTRWEAAGATYPVWMANKIVITAYSEHPDGKGKLALSDVPTKGIDFVDGLATGCLLLKRSVFDKLSKPYFEFTFDPDTREMIGGEDLGFCTKLNKLGIKFFTDFSMVCNHYKNVGLLDLNNYAIDYSNSHVLEYDNSIRPKVNVLANRVVELTQQLNLAKTEIQKLRGGARPSGLIIP